MKPCSLKVFGWLLALAMAAVAAGCSKNEVKLSFELPADVNMPCRMVYYETGENGAMVRETVVEIAKGKAEAVLPLQYPALIYLFPTSGKEPQAVIYARRGEKFKITGPGPGMLEWDIAGNKTTEELSNWRVKNKDILQNRKAGAVKLKKAVADYVEANPRSEAAAIILYLYYPRKDNEKAFYALENKLDADVKTNNDLTAALSAGDLSTSLPDRFALPASLVLTGEEGYADTVELKGGSGGTLLLFRAPGKENFEPDTLKALLKGRGKNNVAEITMDYDSLSWRRYLKRDTIPGLKRLWMPLGVADSAAIGMGVKRVPYFIVVGKNGKELYRGDSIDVAIKKFESIKP